MGATNRDFQPDQQGRATDESSVEVSPELQDNVVTSFGPGEKLTRAKVLQLQRTIGNQAVQRIIQNARQLKNTSPGTNPVKEIQRDQVASDRGNGYGTLENTEENFGTAGGKRQTGLKGFVLPSPTTRDAAKNASPLSFVSTGIGEGNMPAELRGYDRGHIMAVASSGPNTSKNVVPQHPRVNGGGAWKKFEGQTLSEAKKLHGRTDNKDISHGVFAEITINYDDLTSRIPASFDVKATLKDRDVTVKRGRDFKKKGKNIHGNTLNAIPGHLAAVSVSQINNKGIEQTEAKLKEREEKLKKTRGDAKSKPPVDSKTLGPLPPADYRPYAVLEGTVSNVTPANGKFQKEQIQQILAYNVKKNGQLLSDAPNDRYPLLKEHGKMSRPEIDHIVPQSEGGFNAFSNARVVSSWLNRHKEQVVSAEDKQKRLNSTYNPKMDKKYKARKEGAHERQFSFRASLKAEHARYEKLKMKLLAANGATKNQKYNNIFGELQSAHQANVLEMNARYLQAVATNKKFDREAVNEIIQTQLEKATDLIKNLKADSTFGDDPEDFMDDDDEIMELDESEDEDDEIVSDTEDSENSEEEEEDEDAVDIDVDEDEDNGDASEEEDEEEEEQQPPRRKVFASRKVPFSSKNS